jgi:hypothetical protein
MNPNDLRRHVDIGDGLSEGLLPVGYGSGCRAASAHNRDSAVRRLGARKAGNFVD